MKNWVENIQAVAIIMVYYLEDRNLIIYNIFAIVQSTVSDLLKDSNLLGLE